MNPHKYELTMTEQAYTSEGYDIGVYSLQRTLYTSDNVIECLQDMGVDVDAHIAERVFDFALETDIDEDDVEIESIMLFQPGDTFKVKETCLLFDESDELIEVRVNSVNPEGYSSI